MPDPNYYAETGEQVSQDDFDKALEEQKKFALEQQEKREEEEKEARENEVDSPTPAADLGEGGLIGGSEDTPGPTGSSDPDKLAERQQNVAETGSTVSEDEVKSDDDKKEESKPAAKKSAAKKN